MEKIILSKRVAVALEKALSNNLNNKEVILKIHSDVCNYDYKDWSGGNFQYLNELSLEQMAIALYVGYQVEETPEEKLLNLYGYYIENSDNGIEEDVIETVLEILGIKIEGINC